MRAAEEHALAQAQSQAVSVKAEVEVALDTARTRAQELAATKNPNNLLTLSREQVNAMTREVLALNPQYIGVWTLWEPNAFDGQDSRYVNSKIYRPTGRFLPYWNRGRGIIEGEPIVNYETGPWYQEPRRTHQEYISNPYFYPVMGRDVLMISVVAPIVFDGTFYGVAGEDIPISFLQDMANAVELYDHTARLYLVTANSTVAAATGQPEGIGSSASRFLGREVQDYVASTSKTGRQHIVLAQGQLFAMVPIHFGHVPTPWAAVISIPSDKIYAPANQPMWRLLELASLMIIMGVAALGLVAWRISRPVSKVTEVARQVARGDLTRTVAGEERSDELGVLAGTFNHMIEQLRRYHEHLEELVRMRTSQLEVAKEKAETANRTKSVFLASISHELRTPLNAVLGFSQLLRNDPGLTEEQHSNLQVITKSGEHLLGLINNVLDLSKIEAGRMALNEAPFDLHSLLEEMRSWMHVRAVEKGLTFRVEQSPETPRYVSGDSGKLRQILINLAGNAVKYTREGSVTLRAGLARKEGSRAWVRFEIEDTGPGIREADRERIFFPFVRLGEQQITEAGTGLGLPISKQLTELMGGHIKVEGALGKGSRFSIDLPLLLLSQEAICAKPLRGAVQGLEEGQPHFRLLIAEDQLENRLLLRKILQPLGFELREATNGKEAVSIFRQWHPHLIWMDIRMPEMDGLEASRRIQGIQTSEPGPRAKIVALTAHALEDERREILAAGCDDLVRKPYRDSDILEALAKHLKARFVFKKEESTRGQPSRVLEASQLSVFPPELVEELKRSTEQLNARLCLDAARRMAEIDPGIGERLEQIVEERRFQELLELLDQWRPSEGT